MPDPTCRNSNLSYRVIEAIASAEGVDPFELSPPLYTVVDPEALDTVFTGETGTIQFQYCGYDVLAAASGEVELDPIA